MRSGDPTRGDGAPSGRHAAGAFPADIGTPTSIGSLPHTDSDEAVAFVLDQMPEMPAAPTLPQRDPREGMIPQALWGIPGVDVRADGSFALDVGALDPEAPIGDPGLLGAPFVTLQAFLRAVTGRTGAIKVQLTGPITLAKALAAEGVAPGLAVSVAGGAVRQRAFHLLDVVAAAAPQAPVVAFLDEPGLVGGAAADLADPDTTIDVVSSVLAAWEPRAVTGVHCCGPADWKALLQAGPRVLSAPVGAGFGPSAGALAAFLERDGWIAWGAVPTDRPLGDSPSRWWRDLSAQWCSLVQAGCDPVRIRRQALVTPACGLALHALPQVDRVHELARELGLRIRDQLAGVRLSVGA